MEWLLFLSQIPTHPSSLRVNVWRKLRAAGALGLQNGVWVLPKTPEHIKFLVELLETIQRQNATGQILTVAPLDKKIEQDILARFHADRDEEYVEFHERSQAFLAEIKKETAMQKFTYAELEENEQDLLRLANWLEKIQKRDFLKGENFHLADEALVNCRSAFDAFSAEVYYRQITQSAIYSDDADTSSNYKQPTE